MASSDKVNQTTTTSTAEEINYCRVVYADKKKASQIVPVSNIYHGKRRKRRIACTGEFLKRYLANPNENATLRVKEYIPESHIINYHKVCIVACGATENELNEEKCSALPLGRGKRIVKKKNFSDSPFTEQSPAVRAETQQGRKTEPKELTEEQLLFKVMKRERKTKKESLAEIMVGVESTEEIKPTLKLVKTE